MAAMDVLRHRESRKLWRAFGLWAVPGFFLAVSSTTVSSAQLPDGIHAHYRFDGDGSDTCNAGHPFEFKGVDFAGNTLYLNGRYEYGSKGYRAVVDVPWLAYDSFTISLEFNPVFSGKKEGLLISFLNPGRTETNNIITGGTSHRWFSLRSGQNKKLELTLNNQDYVYTFKKAVVQEKSWNRVICCVDLKNRLIRTFYNHARQEDIHLPSDFVLRVRPSDNDEKLTFTNYSNGSTFYGYVDNLRIWDRALQDHEISSLVFDPLPRQGGRTFYLKWVALILCTALLLFGLYLRGTRKVSWQRS
ncbi:MAG: hypothetical protein JSW27_06810 [Phycisphaerales bacterium]|nr:MAG: hypothetical protein JSW27_06810 [Phycisphaerales bacterium]